MEYTKKKTYFCSLFKLNKISHKIKQQNIIFL